MPVVSRTAIIASIDAEIAQYQRLAYYAATAPFQGGGGTREYYAKERQLAAILARKGVEPVSKLPASDPRWSAYDDTKRGVNRYRNNDIDRSAMSSLPLDEVGINDF